MKEKHSDEFGFCFNIDGKRCIKYADIHIFADTKSYQLVLVKVANYYTVLMNDFRSYPTVDLLKDALEHLKDADFTAMSQTDKPDPKMFNDLLNIIDDAKQYFSIKNYILRTTKDEVTYTSTPYFINEMIQPEKLILIRTNIQISISALISKKDCELIKRFDKKFSIHQGWKLLYPDLICIEATPIADSMLLRMCSDFEYLMRKSTLNKTLVSGTTMWHLETLGLSINIDRDEEIGIQMEGEKLPETNRRFFFVFSITGIKVKNDIRFGLVTFTNDAGIDAQTEGEFKSRVSKPTDCYAQLMITSESLLGATRKVISALNKALNLLLMVLFDDSAKQFFSLSDNLSSWQYNVLDSRVEVDNHFWVEDVLNNCYAILSTEHKKLITATQIGIETENLLNDVNLLEDFFYGAENKTKTNLLQSIFWLNESYKKREKKERIISLYNAIEFLLTGQKGETLGDTLKAEYGDQYTSAIASIFECVSKIDNEQLRNRIDGVYRNAFGGNASVQSKLTTLLKELNIHFSEEEWDLFEKLKQGRQKLIHNKKTKKEITEQELDELYHIISKVVVYKIVSLRGDEAND